MVKLVSFGYKYGTPKVGQYYRKPIDLRKSIRNPWRDPTLRNLTGLDLKVQEYVGNCHATKKLLSKETVRIFRLIKYGSDHPTLYFGCHGGKHRSVAIVELLAQALLDSSLDVEITHRDLNHDDSKANKEPLNAKT